MDEMNTGAVATTESIHGGQNAQQPAQMPEPATVFGFAPEDEAGAAAPQETDPQYDQQDANTGAEERGRSGIHRMPDLEGGLPGEQSVDPRAPAFQNERKRDAFADQRRALERKYRNDPARVVGEKILKDRMQRDGTNRRQAYEDVMKKLNEATDASIAEELDVTPGMAKYLRETRESIQSLRGDLHRRGDRVEPDTDYETEEPQDPYAEEAEGPAGMSDEERAKAIIDEFLQMPVPRGFSKDAAIDDPEFVQLLTEYPVAAAVRIYNAEHMAPQQVADRLRARQSVPASTRPTQAIRPEPNYREMSSEDFFKMKERVAKNIY